MIPRSVLLLFLVCAFTRAEWELPFTIDIDILKHIAGWSPLLTAEYIPVNYQVSRGPLVEKRPGLVSPSSCTSNRGPGGCLYEQEFPSPSPLQTEEPVNATAVCPPYGIGETVQPEIILPGYGPGGTCSWSPSQPLAALLNSSTTCRVDLPAGASSCSSIDTFLLAFWSSLRLPEEACNCGECLVPVVEWTDEPSNETSSSEKMCEVTSGIEISITEKGGRINGFVVRRLTTQLAGPVASLLMQIDVRFYQYEEPSKKARFYLRRGRFWCPSEVSCWAEVWYPLSSPRPLSWPSIALRVVIAIVIAFVLWRLLHSPTLPPSDTSLKRLSHTEKRLGNLFEAPPF